MCDEKIGLAARLTPEPDNEYDKMAILVEIDWADGFKPVGWIPSELTKFIHPILNEKEYLSVSVKHIKFLWLLWFKGRESSVPGVLCYEGIFALFILVCLCLDDPFFSEPVFRVHVVIF